MLRRDSATHVTHIDRPLDHPSVEAKGDAHLILGANPSAMRSRLPRPRGRPASRRHQGRPASASLASLSARAPRQATPEATPEEEGRRFGERASTNLRN